MVQLVTETTTQIRLHLNIVPALYTTTNHDKVGNWPRVHRQGQLVNRLTDR